MVTVKARDGSMMNVKLADDARIMAFERRRSADIKNDSFIGVTACRKPDGSSEAFAIHIFLAGAARHRPEGFRPLGCCGRTAR